MWGLDSYKVPVRERLEKAGSPLQVIIATRNLGKKRSSLGCKNERLVQVIKLLLKRDRNQTRNCECQSVSQSIDLQSDGIVPVFLFPLSFLFLSPFTSSNN